MMITPQTNGLKAGSRNPLKPPPCEWLPVMNPPKITIVTPSYNQGEFLEATIRSVLDQQYPNLEYFVVDGGSTDNSVEIIKRYENHIDWWVSEKDRGQSHAINKGLQRATGDIVTWLNSDDFFYPGVFDIIAQAFQAHPQAGLFVGNGTLADREGRRVRRYSRTVAWDYDILLRGANYILQPSTFLHRRVFDEQGLIDENIAYGMDLELWLRVGNKYPVVTIDEELAAFRWYDEVKSVSGGFKEWVSMFEIMRRYCKDPLTPGLVLELFKKLQDRKIQEAAGFSSLPEFSQKAYGSFYNEIQKLLGTDDCIPLVNKGTPFTPRRSQPAGAAPSAKARSAGRARPGGSKPVVDIVLPEGHSWFVREGYAAALKRLGCLGRTFHVPSWKQDDPRSAELFEYLRRPQADVIFLMDTLWHAQHVHATEAWRSRWADCPARKILFSFECMNNPVIRANARWWDDTLNAVKQASSCVDAFVYAHEIDGELFRQFARPALWQPFAVDETIFPELKDFAARKPRAFFKGKAERFYDDDNCYRQRRELIEYLRGHAPNTDVVDQYSFAAGGVLERNQQFIREMGEYQVVVGLPSLSPTMVVRPFEAMLAGCVFVQNRVQGEASSRLFRDGEHLLLYDAARPEELVEKINSVLADPDLGRRIAANGRAEVLAKHTLHHRVAGVLPWIEEHISTRAAVPTTASVKPSVHPRSRATESAPAAPRLVTFEPVDGPVLTCTASESERRRGGRILIDGVTFQLQHRNPAGISRVWASLLGQLAKSALANDIVLLDRGNTAPKIPGIRTCPIPPYDIFHFESDSIYLQEICNREGAGLFISTYYTYPEHTHSMVMLHDMIPEIMGQDLTHAEWRSKSRGIEKAGAYFSVSQATLNDFRRLFPQYAGRKVFLTPNAVGDELSPAPPQQVRRFQEKHGIRNPYFLLVGNRTLYKNAMLFFRAFGLLPDRGQLEVVCAGGAPELENVFKPFVKDSSCRVLRLADDELASAYTGALALVYPSQYEGFGLPIVEAQKCGCPVITCRNSSIPEVAGETVLYIGESDVAGMASALNEVRSPQVRQRLTDAGRNNAARFSWETTAQTMITALGETRVTTGVAPLRPGDPLDMIDRLSAALSPGNQHSRELSRHIRTLTRLYRGIERLDTERLNSTEAFVAAYLNRLLPGLKPQIPPMESQDSLLSFVLGLEAEVRKDWGASWKLYSRALQAAPNDLTPLYSLRLGLRLAKAANADGDAATAKSVMQQVVQPLRRFIPPTMDLATEEAAIHNWQVVVKVAGRAHKALPTKAAPEATAGPGDTAPTPRVSVIVSAYKSERFLRGCLEDLEAQTIADRLEIIVVDSHSPENERAIVEEFQKRCSNIVYIRTEKRETVYGAWNRAARVARGQYLTNANTDDRHRDDALEILARTLDRNPDLTLVYADCLVTPHENETFDRAHPVGCYQWLEFDAKTLLQKGCFVGPQPMWRREAHDEYGYFDAEMVSAGDYDFWLRLAQTRRFLHVRETLGLYLDSPTSVEHSNREAAVREIKVAQDRYRDAIFFGKAPVRPQSAAAASPAKPAPLPAAGRIGDLNVARGQLGRREYAVAWNETLQAIEKRPFHPEAFLLLAEIALAAGNGAAARTCAQHASELAPGWKAPKQFLQKPLNGNARPDWLVVPDAVASRNAQRAHRLTVCVIAKNEEPFIEQCLKSIQPVAHQIVVVDTGSTDRTVEIATGLGAEVHHFDWCDHFGAARNAALEHATGDWILILDADEELAADQHARLHADLQSAGLIACRLPLVNQGQEAEGVSHVPRLFRNAPGAHFSGRIHEQIFPSLIALSKNWGLQAGLGTARLLHHGYTKELVKDRSKIDRNLRLLRQAVEECPADPNLVMNLGLELVRSGDLSGGLTHYREAFRLMSALPPGGAAPELREALLTQYTCHLYKAREHDTVVRVLDSPLAKSGGLTASLHFALGLASFELKQYREAAEQMRRCLARRKESALSPINTDILTAAPHHCLALSLARLGYAAGAEKAFEAAFQETGPTPNLRLDYARFLADQNRPVDALKRLHEIVTEDAASVPAWRLGGEIALSRLEFLAFAHDWTGEAIRRLPDDAVVIAQRAEVLLLRQEVANARPLWERACKASRPPRALAAFILCSAAGSEQVSPTRGADEETATSQAFVEWYRRLISAGANETVGRLNSRVDALRDALPTAARLLDSAIAEVQKQPA
jgi:glycosyltransferase involved in cell wall biosynthesis